MKLYKLSILLFIVLSIFSCGKNDQNEETDTTIETETSKDIKVNDSIGSVNESILTSNTYKIKEAKVFINKTDENVKPNLDSPETTSETTSKIPSEITSETTSENNAETKNTNPSFFYIKKILSDCKVGETFTQKELSTQYDIPKDAIKLVKSINKVSDNEIDVKWKSSWLIEKMSDAKLKDGKLKVNFKGNKMYTSGDAIGIKYNKKMYTNLVITGRTARIPSVKGFYWQIGKDSK